VHRQRVRAVARDALESPMRPVLNTPAAAAAVLIPYLLLVPPILLVRAWLDAPAGDHVSDVAAAARADELGSALRAGVRNRARDARRAVAQGNA
jgi:hypothetical protein